MDQSADWPQDVQAAMNALGTTLPPPLDRRRTARSRYRTAGTLRFADPTLGRPRTVYLRDAGRWSAGFIVRDELACHVHATLTVTSPVGTPAEIACRVRRCRQFCDGWYEASIDFDTEQPALTARPTCPRRRFA